MTMSEMSVNDETPKNSCKTSSSNFIWNQSNFQIQYNLTIKVILFRMILHKTNGQYADNQRTTLYVLLDADFNAFFVFYSAIITG